MGKAVLTTKVVPTYDDLPEVRYHFPRTYLNHVEAAIGDWIVYYEPRRVTGDLSSRGGRQAYFAMARVRGDGQTNKGAFGRAVRTMPDDEFEMIVAAGFMQQLRLAPTAVHPGSRLAGFAEPDSAFDIVPRPIVEVTLARPFRDQAFRRQICQAYDNRCAISGLKLINGGGRSEVQAAHIRPVASNGPDSIRNGLALTGTLHWMFDRGLLSIDDDLRILKAKELPPDVHRLVDPNAQLRLPEAEALHPHPLFLRYHRENVFKG